MAFRPVLDPCRSDIALLPTSSSHRVTSLPPAVCRHFKHVFLDPVTAFQEALRLVGNEGKTILFQDGLARLVPKRVASDDPRGVQVAKAESAHSPRRFRHVSISLMLRMCPEADVPNVFVTLGSRGDPTYEFIRLLQLDRESISTVLFPSLYVTFKGIDQFNFHRGRLPKHAVVESLESRRAEYMGNIGFRYKP